MSSDDGQAALLKVLVTLAILTFLAIDLGKPFVRSVDLDSRAKKVAGASSESFRLHHDEDEAREVAQQQADLDHALLTEWSVKDTDNTVSVTLEKTLPSWVFGKIFKSWYTVRASARERAVG